MNAKDATVISSGIENSTDDVDKFFEKMINQIKYSASYGSYQTNYENLCGKINLPTIRIVKQRLEDLGYYVTIYGYDNDLHVRWGGKPDTFLDKIAFWFN